MPTTVNQYEVMLATSLGDHEVRLQLEALERAARHAAEVKYDGHRALAYFDDGKLVKLTSRNEGQDMRDRFPEVVRNLEDAFASRKGHLVLDGEVGFLDPTRVKMDISRVQARARSDRLAIRMHARKYPMTYVAFDVLHAGEAATWSSPYSARRALLEQVVPDAPGLEVSIASSHLVELYDRVCGLAGEGIMVKVKAAPYEPGKRSKAWLKAKAPNTYQDGLFVVGLTPGEGKRATAFGSLILARPTNEGAFEYVVRAGSGLSNDDIQRIMDATPRLRVDDALVMNAREVERKAGGILMWLRPEIQVDIVFDPPTKVSPRFPRIKSVTVPA